MRSLILVPFLLCGATAYADQEGNCDINITGALTMSNQSKTLVVPASASYQDKADAKRVHATADYWLSDAEMKAQLEVTAGFKLGSKKTPEALQEAVDAAMLKNPRLYLVAMGCGDKNLSLQLSPVRGSKYANVPFKPGHYIITENREHPQPGAFEAQLAIGETPNVTIYRASGPGTLDIQQFDTQGLAGKFSYKALSFDKSKAIKVTGTFKYSCAGGKCTK